MVAKALRHFFNISIGMPFVHKMYGRIGLCHMDLNLLTSNGLIIKSRYYDLNDTTCIVNISV